MLSHEVGDNLVKHLDGAGLDHVHTGTSLGLLPRTGVDGLGLALISRGVSEYACRLRLIGSQTQVDFKANLW